MDNTRSLPAGFESLDPFVAAWVLPDAAARMTKRQNSSYEEIRRFHDAMIPLGEKALDYLGGFQVYNGFEVARIRYVKQIPDTSAQR